MAISEAQACHRLRLREPVATQPSRRGNAPCGGAPLKVRFLFYQRAHHQATGSNRTEGPEGMAVPSGPDDWAPVAQWREQRFAKPQVPGPNPGGGTSLSPRQNCTPRDSGPARLDPGCTFRTTWENTVNKSLT